MAMIPYKNVVMKQSRGNSVSVGISVSYFALRAISSLNSFSNS